MTRKEMPVLQAHETIQPVGFPGPIVAEVRRGQLKPVMPDRDDTRAPSTDGSK